MYPLISEVEQSESPVVLHQSVRDKPFHVIDIHQPKVVLLLGRARDASNQLKQLRVTRVVGVKTRSLCVLIQNIDGKYFHA